VAKCFLLTVLYSCTSAQYALGFCCFFLIFISCLKLPKLITVNGPKSEIYWFSFFPPFVLYVNTRIALLATLIGFLIIIYFQISKVTANLKRALISFGCFGFILFIQKMPI
jgi:hypothetical protein